jgi:hypothetical protein
VAFLSPEQIEQSPDATSDHYQARDGNKDNENISDHFQPPLNRINSDWLGASCLGRRSARFVCLFVWTASRDFEARILKERKILQKQWISRGGGQNLLTLFIKIPPRKFTLKF